MIPPLAGLVAVPLVLAAGAFLGARGLTPAQRAVLAGGVLLAVPVAAAVALSLGRRLAEARSPVPHDGLAPLLALAALPFVVTEALALRVPWRRAWPWALVLPLVLVLLLVASAGLAASGSRSARGGALMGAVFLLAATLAPSMLPRALAHARPDAPPRALAAAGLALALALGGLGGAFLVLVTTTEGGFGTDPARREWRVELAPADDATPYALEVPFVVSPDAAQAEVLAMWRDKIHVAQGRAEVHWTEDGRALRVEGTGPVTLEAVVEYWGANAHRERMGDYAVAPVPLAFLDGPAEGVEVRWRVSGNGGGHSCGGIGEATARAGPEGSEALAPEWSFMCV